MSPAVDPFTPAYPGVPAQEANADLTFAYDEGGARVLKTTMESGAARWSDAEIFSTLRLEGASYSVSAGDYDHSASTESVSLGVGRVIYRAGEALRVFLEVANHLGSTSIVIDKDTSELVERVTYLAYGATDSDYRPTKWHSFRDRYRMTGKEEDIEVGLTYFGARYYIAALGRWASADPMTIHTVSSDLNPYAYVSGSPLALTDPTGLSGSIDNSDNPPEEDRGDESWNTSGPIEIFLPETAIGGTDPYAGHDDPRSFSDAEVTDDGSLLTKDPSSQRGSPFDATIWDSRSGQRWNPNASSKDETMILGSRTEKGFSDLERFMRIPEITMFATVVVSFVPVVGQLLALADVTDSEAPTWRRALGVAGMLPMVGGVLREGGAAVRGFATSTRGASRLISDAAIVCRGGTCTAERFLNGSGVLSNAAGKLSGVSVNVGHGTVADVAATLRYKQIGVTTVRDIRAAGGTLTPRPTAMNPLHHELSGLSAETLEKLFTPTVRNPNL